MKQLSLSFGALAVLAAATLFAADASAQTSRGAPQELDGAPGSRIPPPAAPSITPPVIRPTTPPPAPAPVQQYQRAPDDDDFDRGPDAYRDRDRDRDDDWARRDRVDFQRAQESCSRMAIREAWQRGYYSAQYEGGPRIEWTRGGPELRGRMRLHDRRGYSYFDTSCELRRNSEASDFDFRW